MTEHQALTRELAAILRAVRPLSGSATLQDVCRATGLPRQTVIELAELLVCQGLLCALDGEPWALRVEALALPIWGAP